MRYKNQLVTLVLVVETAPAQPYNPGASAYIAIPKDFNVFRVSIYNDEAITGASVTGLFSTTASENATDYVQIPFTSRDFYPFKLEAKNGYIVDGFYLGVLSINPGDNCTFHILFEGEIED